MCNLYKMTKTVDEVARLFGAVADPPGNAGDTVYPGYPGHVTIAAQSLPWARRLVGGEGGESTSSSLTPPATDDLGAGSRDGSPFDWLRTGIGQHKPQKGCCRTGFFLNEVASVCARQAGRKLC
jgi:hypothetical protein